MVATPYNKKANPVYLVDQSDGTPYTSAGAVLTDIGVSNLPATVDTNVGAAGASTLRVAFASSSTVALAAGTAAIGKVTPNGATTNHITTATTTTISGAHTLQSIVLNSLGTVASTVTVKDNATVLAVIDSLDTTGRTGTYTYNVACATSIVIVTTGTIAPDVTVTYF